MLEEKCLRAITGGSIHDYYTARSSGNEFLVDSSKRTLIRLRDLIDTMQETMKSEAWLFEVSAHLNSEMGWKGDIIDDLMKEYRLMQSDNWELDPLKVTKMVALTKDIFNWHKDERTMESLSKCKLLINGVRKKIHGVSEYADAQKEVTELDMMLEELEETIASSKS